MPTKRIQEVVSGLSFEKKLVGAGSLLMLVSIFLPWYQDLDSFKTGDMFLGITGPLYLIGVSLLLLAGLNLATLWMDVNAKKLPLGSVKPASLYLFSGMFAFYMLMVVNSVYFHDRFGLNITMKQSQFGMFFAFIAASFLTVGGYLSGRNKASLLKEFQDEAIPTVKMDHRKSKENLRPQGLKQEGPEQQTKFAEEKDPEWRTFYPLPEKNEQPEKTQQSPSPAVAEKTESNRNNHQPFRVDL